MPYLEDITEPLIHALTHTGGLPVHQLAGHAANLQFWAGEVRHAFDVIDGYPRRFKNIQEGERAYVARQELQEPATSRPRISGPPIQRGIKDTELKHLRRRVADAMYHVLDRCYREELILEAELDHLAEHLGFDVREIKRKR